MFSMLLVSTEVLKVADPLLKILMAVISIALVVLIMMQDGNTTNITGLTNSGNDSFFSKNKAASKENRLKKVTLILGSSLLVVTVAFFLFQIL